jgi:proteic killer suppression protein
MDITFNSKKLAKQLNDDKAMVKAYGAVSARKLQKILTQFHAAPNLGNFAPPYSPPHRCHELTGNRKGQLSVDVEHPYRLVFEPADEPLPMREEGGLDWGKVTRIKIKKVEDTHG